MSDGQKYNNVTLLEGYIEKERERDSKIEKERIRERKR